MRLLSLTYHRDSGGQLRTITGNALKARQKLAGDNPAAIRALLQRKADVNAAQVDGATAIHWAVYHDDLDTADLLIRAGANVKAALGFVLER